MRTGLTLCFVIALGLGIGFGVSGPGKRKPVNSASAPSRTSANLDQQRSLPPTVPLKVAGALAVSPDGLLFVADVSRDEVLKRLPDGRFADVAGDGRSGFTGDGGPATKAELMSVSGLAFGADGTLYIADGPRVREVTANGTIRTVAGSGRFGMRVYLPQALVKSGAPALAASLDPQNFLSIALSPSGVLYISTGKQLLRLIDGRLYEVRAMVHGMPPGMNGQMSFDLGQVAVDHAGNVDVSGFNGWALWQVSLTGDATQLSTPGNGEERQSGGDTSVLEQGPGDFIYAEDGGTIFRIEGTRLVPFKNFGDVAGQWFTLTNFAFAPNGTLYADDLNGGGGFQLDQLLIAVQNRHTRVLWQQHNKSSP